MGNLVIRLGNPLPLSLWCSHRDSSQSLCIDFEMRPSRVRQEISMLMSLSKLWTGTYPRVRQYHQWRVFVFLKLIQFKCLSFGNIVNAVQNIVPLMCQVKLKSCHHWAFGSKCIFKGALFHSMLQILGSKYTGSGVCVKVHSGSGVCVKIYCILPYWKRCLLQNSTPNTQTMITQNIG